MIKKPRTERSTQERVINLFTNKNHSDYLGYKFLGDWHLKERNSCIEKDLLRQNLENRGYSAQHINAALHKLELAAESTGVSLYHANLRTYNMLRYGVKVQIIAGHSYETVHLIDWENTEENDFAIAEEVTLKGGFQRRPDLVI